MAQKLKALAILCRGPAPVPVPVPGSSQPLVTLVPEDPTPTSKISGTCTTFKHTHIFRGNIIPNNQHFKGKKKQGIS